jgi:DNA-binding SARP family transcriptional activator
VLAADPTRASRARLQEHMVQSMLGLRTFAFLEFEGTDRPFTGAAVRPRPLALLVMVALAHSRGISRDTLLAYFWPESDSEHARNCLKQTLFTLRRDVDGNLFLADRGFLRVNPAVLTIDVLEFDAAWTRCAYGDAVALYRGPFLDGFHIPYLRELGQWIESERLRLAQRYQASLERLATEAYHAGDRSRAVKWWRQLATLDPLSSRIAIEFMRALSSIGERTHALEHARLHERLIRQEFGAPPDAEVTAYAQWLRQHPEAGPSFPGRYPGHGITLGTGHA